MFGVPVRFQVAKPFRERVDILAMIDPRIGDLLGSPVVLQTMDDNGCSGRLSVAGGKLPSKAQRRG